MSLSTPHLDISRRLYYINRLSVKIEGLEKNIHKRMKRIVALDFYLRDRIGVAQDIALARLEVIKDLMRTNHSASALEQAQRDLSEKMNGIRDDYFINFASLMNIHSYTVRHKEIIFSTPAKQQALQRFCEKLDAQTENYFNEYSLSHIQSLEEEKERLETEIEERKAKASASCDAKIYHLFQERIDYQAILSSHTECEILEKKREKLNDAKNAINISMAAQVGDLNFIRKWLQTNNANRRDNSGFTPLHYAAYHTQLPAVALLLESGAHNAYLDQSIYHALADRTQTNAISQEARKGVSTQTNVGSTALHWAVRAGSVYSASMLLNPEIKGIKKANINAKGPYNRTPLHDAVLKNDYSMTAFLLDNGSDINAVTNDYDNRKTPLYIATTQLDLKMVQLLCKSPDLNPNLETGKGDSPLYRAIDELNQLKPGMENELENSLIMIVLAILNHPEFHASVDANNHNALESLIDFAKSIRVKRILEKKREEKVRTLDENDVLDTEACAIGQVANQEDYPSTALLARQVFFHKDTLFSIISHLEDPIDLISLASTSRDFKDRIAFELPWKGVANALHKIFPWVKVDDSQTPPPYRQHSMAYLHEFHYIMSDVIMVDPGAKGGHLAGLTIEKIQSLLEARDRLIVWNALENKINSFLNRFFIAPPFNTTSNYKQILRINKLKVWYPGNTVQDLRRLDLSNLKLTSLPSNMLDGVSKLEVLNLENNLLTKLPSFSGLSELRWLYLENNQLIELPSSIFQRKLEVLNAENNHIATFPDVSSLILGPKQLFLAGNQLTNLPASTSLFFPNLEVLSLEDNALSELPNSISLSPNLKQLFLVGNQLTKLPDSLSQLTQLQVLRLSYNRLSFDALSTTLKGWMKRNEFELDMQIIEKQNDEKELY